MTDLSYQGGSRGYYKKKKSQKHELLHASNTTAFFKFLR